MSTRWFLQVGHASSQWQRKRALLGKDLVEFACFPPVAHVLVATDWQFAPLQIAILHVLFGILSSVGSFVLANLRETLFLSGFTKRVGPDQLYLTVHDAVLFAVKHDGPRKPVFKVIYCTSHNSFTVLFYESCFAVADSVGRRGQCGRLRKTHR